MKRLESGRSVLALLAAAGLMLGIVASAYGFGVVQRSTFQSGNNWCMLKRAAMNTRQTSSDVRGEVSGTVYSYKSGCNAFKTKDRRKLRTKTKVLKVTNGVARPCIGYEPYGYNSSPAQATSSVHSYGGGFNCGSGQYKVQAKVGLKNNGNWKTGTVRSPKHYWQD